MSHVSKGVIPFRMGDVVSYKKKEHIIHEVTLNEVGNYEYATDRQAWIDHQDLKLVRQADKNTLKELYDSIWLDSEDYEIHTEE